MFWDQELVGLNLDPVGRLRQGPNIIIINRQTDKSHFPILTKLHGFKNKQDLT